MRRTSAIIGAICILVFSAHATAHQRNVPAEYPTIQAAIDAAVDGDEIIVADGTYTGEGNRDIVLDKSITIRSESGPQNCAIDCNATQTDRHNGFYVKSDATLVGLTIINGHAEREGGAIFCSYNSRPRIINCTISGNSAGRYGGAVYCDGQSSPEIINCTITANSAEAGGAIYSDYGSNPTLYNCTIAENSASGTGWRGGGGAIWCSGDTAVITNSHIARNSAIAGGAVYCDSGSLTVRNCTIDENTASGTGSQARGGAICCSGQTAVITNSHVARNSAIAGGAVYCDSGSLTIRNCTIDENTASGTGRPVRGGGIYGGDRVKLSITNSNITHNVGKAEEISYGGGIYCFDDTSLTVENCTISQNIAEAREASGGGIFYDGDYTLSALTISDTTVADNKAQSTHKSSKETYGGGVYCRDGDLIILKGTISGNSAAEGSGLYCEYSNPVIAGCVISGNYPTNRHWNGSAMRLKQSSVIISDCTIVGNAASGLYSQGSDTLITNSILFHNDYGGHCPGPQIRGCCPTVTYCDVQEPRQGQGNIRADPCFVDAGAGYWDDNGTPEDREDDFWRWSDGDYHLLPTSPCINAGGGGYLLNNTDFDGNPRIIDGIIDMGAYEAPLNTSPVADAGRDQTIYASARGVAQATLDGTASYDDDGDPLTYQWAWTVDAVAYEANSVNPTIELPTGEHTITLIVHDGTEHSEPDQVIVTVLPAVEVGMQLTPQTLNCAAKGKYVKAHMVLPEGILAEDVDVNTPAVAEPPDVESEYMKLVGGDDGPVELEIAFDRAAFCEALTETGEIEATVTGLLTTGQEFYGSDVFRIVGPGRKRILRRRIAR